MILGIDIGGTNTKLALLSGKRVLRFQKIATAKKAAGLVEAAKTFLSGVRARQIGVGVAGIVNQKKGMLVKSVNIPQLARVPIVKLLQREFKVQARIDNDARCFTRAEALLGAGKGKQTVLGITVGTGIGTGFAIGGQVWSGTRFAAGEAGHAYFNERKEWEIIAGKKFFKKFGKSPEMLATQARGGSKLAKKAFQQRGYNLGIGIANLINILDPEIVVLGGGAMKEADLFLPVAIKTAQKFIFNPSAKNIKIVPGKLGEKAGAIGAALLFSF